MLKGLDEVLILKLYKQHNKYLMARKQRWLSLCTAKGSTVQNKHSPRLILCSVCPTTAPENVLQKQAILKIKYCSPQREIKTSTQRAQSSFKVTNNMRKHKLVVLELQSYFFKS